MLARDTVLAGKYVIVGPLESGGMGDVYDAIQTDLSRPVAIKVLRADLAADAWAFLRFRREAEAAASLGHPNIVQILDFRNEPGEPPILVMERLAGRSLRNLLVEESTLPPPRAALIALQILAALAAAHDASIVHRDMKPSNVFILTTFAVRDLVKVLDFGIAKVLEPNGGAVLTELGQVLGTVAYMAPEQARGLQVDGRADLFAVGAILFEALSGQRPRTLGPAAVIDAASKPCAKLRAVAAGIDPQLAAVVDRALSLDRNARFPNAAAMAAALAPFGRLEPIEVAGIENAEATLRDDEGAAPENATTATGRATAHLAPRRHDASPLLATLDDPAPIAATQDDVSGPSSPSAAPAPRTSYQPPLLLRPSVPTPASRPQPAQLPPSQRSGVILALAVVVVVLVAIAAAAFVFVDLRGR